MSSLSIDACNVAFADNIVLVATMRDAHSDHVNAIFDLTLNLNLNSLLLYGVVTYFYVASCACHSMECCRVFVALRQKLVNLTSRNSAQLASVSRSSVLHRHAPAVYICSCC